MSLKAGKSVLKTQSLLLPAVDKSLYHLLPLSSGAPAVCDHKFIQLS